MLSFLGIGGRTVSKTLSFDLDKIKAFQPRVIILELGTNDLCVAGQRPETIGSDMERLVQQVLHEHCGAVFIMVCLVIYRSAIPPRPRFQPPSRPSNKYLEVVLEPLPYAEV